MLDINHGWILLERIGEIVLNNVEGCVIEFGIGFSTEVLADLAKRFNRDFYTCDTKGSRCEWAKNNIKYEKAHIVKNLAYNFIIGLKESPALVLHDASHDYNFVKKETEELIKIMKPGSIIFIHDTTPPKWRYDQKIARGKKMNLWYLRKELEQRNDIDVLTWRYTAGDCGLTMILKKDMTDPEYRI